MNSRVGGIEHLHRFKMNTTGGQVEHLRRAR